MLLWHNLVLPGEKVFEFFLETIINNKNNMFPEISFFLENDSTESVFVHIFHHPALGVESSYTLQGFQTSTASK